MGNNLSTKENFISLFFGNKLANKNLPAVEVYFSGNLSSDEASKFLNDVEIVGNTLSGVLYNDPREFISWINAKVDVTSFHLKVPSLEQIFLEEVGKKN